MAPDTATQTGDVESPADTEYPPLPDAPLNPDEIVGELTFSGRLYSEEKAENVCPVDVRTDEPTSTIPTADQVEAWIAKKDEESRQKAAKNSWHDHTDHVALVAGSTEQAGESTLISHAAWFHFDVTGDLETHNTLRLADESDAYSVEWDADYETGTLTVTVDVAE